MPINFFFEAFHLGIVVASVQTHTRTPHVHDQTYNYTQSRRPRPSRDHQNHRIFIGDGNVTVSLWHYARSPTTRDHRNHRSFIGDENIAVPLWYHARRGCRFYSGASPDKKRRSIPEIKPAPAAWPLPPLATLADARSLLCANVFTKFVLWHAPTVLPKFWAGLFA